MPSRSSHLHSNPAAGDGGREYADRLAVVLLEVAQTASSTLDLDEVLGRVAERTASLTGADRCSIWLLDESRERLVPAALYGMDSSFTSNWKHRPLALRAEPLSLEAVTTGQPVVVLDAETDSRTDKSAVALFGDRSILVVPLASKGRIIGTLFLNHVQAPYTYTEHDVAVTRAIAAEAAVSIENAQAYEGARRAKEEMLASFGRIGEALAAGLDVDETLRIIVKLACEMLRASSGCIELVERGRPPAIRATYGFPENGDRVQAGQPNGGLTEEVLRTGQPLRVVDLAPATSTGDSTGGIPEAPSFVGVPLRLRGTVCGVLSVFDDRAGRFSPDDVVVLESFANHAAVALDNAQMFAALRIQIEGQATAMARIAGLYRTLRQREARLDAIIGNSSDAIYMVDEQLRIVGLNPAAEEVFGWSAAAAIGKPCAEVLNCSHRVPGPLGEPLPAPECVPVGSAACPLRTVLAQGEAVPYAELVTDGGKGRVRELAVSYSYVPASDETGPHTVGIARDVSRLKEVERLKSDFISIASHEVRTPLAVIKGYAATLLNPSLRLAPEQEQRFIKGINDASDRLNRLVSNLLCASRLESGRSQPHPRRFDLVELIDGVASAFRDVSGKHEIRAETPESGLSIVADRELIDLVLVNLVANAVKYSPKGGVVTISVEEAGSGVRLRVADRGIGIPPDQVDRIFDRFYRGDNARSSSASGVGLGLYICRSIVEAHGGSIRVESEAGSGSVFQVDLPQAVGQRATPEPALP